MFYLILKGHNYQYEISELLKAFGLFSDINFISEADIPFKEDNSSFFLINNINKEDGGYRIVSKLMKNKTVISSEESYFECNGGKDSYTLTKRLKRSIKLNIYDLVNKSLSIELPWGILTGIRPTKIIHEYLDNNRGVSEIRRVFKKQYRISDEKIELLISVALKERKYLMPLDEDLVSVYISIPYCPSRCIYCSFPSNPLDVGRCDVEAYLSALKLEIEGVGAILYRLNKKVESIYIGGGTPTTLSANQMDRLINQLVENFNISSLKEFTVEAGRPDTITFDKLNVLKKNNVDRISINPQTMNEKTLKLIGRNHTVKDIYEAYNMAKGIGFNNINMDIIVGLPDEGINEIVNTMEQIAKLQPENITVHTLAIKRSSRMRENEEAYNTANEKEAIQMLDITKKYAEKMNLYPYYMYRQKYMVGNLENIGYAKLGHECIYNIQIMEERQSIIALGAGAASKIVYPKENRLERVANVKNVNEYIKRVNEMIERKRIELFNEK